MDILSSSIRAKRNKIRRAAESKIKLYWEVIVPLMKQSKAMEVYQKLKEVHPWMRLFDYDEASGKCKCLKCPTKARRIAIKSFNLKRHLVNVHKEIAKEENVSIKKRNVKRKGENHLSSKLKRQKIAEDAATMTGPKMLKSCVV